MKGPTPKALVADFLSKINVSKSDLCLTFNAAEHHDILAKRIHVQPIDQDMRSPLEVSAKFGFCIGIEDYSEKESVKVLTNIMTAARRCYFYIQARKRPIWWWMKQIHKVGGSRVLTAEQGNFGYKILVTLYTSLDDIEELSAINVDDETVSSNVKTNLALNLREVTPHEEQDVEVAFVLGGPSINDFADEIYAHAKSGMPIVTANGAYNWCLEHNIIPAATIVLDARNFNKRFVQPVVPNCKYLVCSQCDPELTNSIPKDQVWMWHPYGARYNEIIKEYKTTHPELQQDWYPIGGGTTVALRGFPLLITLGFRKFHVYGFDSCVMDTRHHGFAQPEDDGKTIVVVEYGGRSFKCYPWMWHQASDFMKMTQHMIGQFCQMEIYGEGLIAHAIRTLAQGDEDGRNQMDVLQQREAEFEQRSVRPGWHLADADAFV